MHITINLRQLVLLGCSSIFFSGSLTAYGSTGDKEQWPEIYENSLNLFSSGKRDIRADESSTESRLIRGTASNSFGKTFSSSHCFSAYVDIYDESTCSAADCDAYCALKIPCETCNCQPSKGRQDMPNGKREPDYITPDDQCIATCQKHSGNCTSMVCLGMNSKIVRYHSRDFKRSAAQTAPEPSEGINAHQRLERSFAITPYKAKAFAHMWRPLKRLFQKKSSMSTTVATKRDEPQEMASADDNPGQSWTTTPSEAKSFSKTRPKLMRLMEGKGSAVATAATTHPKRDRYLPGSSTSEGLERRSTVDSLELLRHNFNLEKRHDQKSKGSAQAGPFFLLGKTLQEAADSAKAQERRCDEGSSIGCLARRNIPDHTTSEINTESSHREIFPRIDVANGNNNDTGQSEQKRQNLLPLPDGNPGIFAREEGYSHEARGDTKEADGIPPEWNYLKWINFMRPNMKGSTDVSDAKIRERRKFPHGMVIGGPKKTHTKTTHTAVTSLITKTSSIDATTATMPPTTASGRDDDQNGQATSTQIINLAKRENDPTSQNAESTKEVIRPCPRDTASDSSEHANNKRYTLRRPDTNRRLLSCRIYPGSDNCYRHPPPAVDDAGTIKEPQEVEKEKRHDDKPDANDYVVNMGFFEKNKDKDKRQEGSDNAESHLPPPPLHPDSQDKRAAAADIPVDDLDRRQGDNPDADRPRFRLSRLFGKNKEKIKRQEDGDKADSHLLTNPLPAYLKPWKDKRDPPAAIPVDDLDKRQDWSPWWNP